MKLKLLFILLILFVACEKETPIEQDKPIEKPVGKASVKFTNENISLKVGESKLIDIDKAIKECGFSVKDEFYLNVSVNGDEAKLNTKKVGKSEVYVEYKGAKDTCFVTVNPTILSTWVDDPPLGATRQQVKEHFKNYQSGATIGGFYGESVNVGGNEDRFYEFDKEDKLIAIKRVIRKSKFSIDDILRYLDERFNKESNSSTVYWYKIDNKMMVRLERTISNHIIWYAGNSTVMYEKFPW